MLSKATFSIHYPYKKMLFSVHLHPPFTAGRRQKKTSASPLCGWKIPAFLQSRWIPVRTFDEVDATRTSFFVKKRRMNVLCRADALIRQDIDFVERPGGRSHPSTPALRTWRSDLTSTAERMSVKRFDFVIHRDKVQALDYVIRLDKVLAVQRGRLRRPSAKRRNGCRPLRHSRVRRSFFVKKKAVRWG